MFLVHVFVDSWFSCAFAQVALNFSVQFGYWQYRLSRIILIHFQNFYTTVLWFYDVKVFNKIVFFPMWTFEFDTVSSKTHNFYIVHVPSDKLDHTICVVVCFFISFFKYLFNLFFFIFSFLLYYASSKVPSGWYNKLGLKFFGIF